MCKSRTKVKRLPFPSFKKGLNQDIINLPIKTFSKAWKWQLFDFGPTFTHFYLLKNVNFKIQFVVRFVL